MNNYNYMPSTPACAAGQDFTTACYNPSVGVRLRHPRRAAPRSTSRRSSSCRSGPARSGRQSGVANYIIGGWIVAATMSFQSGFPINVQQAADSRLGGAEREPAEPVPGVDLATSGSFDDRLASADHPTATWLNPAAFIAGAGGDVRQRAADDYRCPRRRVSRTSTPRSSRTSGSSARKAAQFKMEIINVLNRPNVRTLQVREHLRQLELRPDEHPGRVHAAAAVHVQVPVLGRAAAWTASDSRASGSRCSHLEPTFDARSLRPEAFPGPLWRRLTPLATSAISVCVRGLCRSTRPCSPACGAHVSTS